MFHINLYNLTGCVVKFYSYRTAIVRNIFITLDRNDHEAKALEDFLAQTAKVNKDNHTCYELFFQDKRLYFMFSDFNVHIGFNLEERSW